MACLSTIERLEKLFEILSNVEWNNYCAALLFVLRLSSRTKEERARGVLPHFIGDDDDLMDEIAFNVICEYELGTIFTEAEDEEARSEILGRYSLRNPNGSGAPAS
ncbi:MAG: hypothetical protein ACREBS_01530 [Nitrososphaerales archaeon]